MEEIKFGIVGVIQILLLSGCNQNPNETLIEPQDNIRVAAEKMNSEYSCSYDLYNCGDFETQEEAQAVFEACDGLSRDVHHLDRDNDWTACEKLP